MATKKFRCTNFANCDLALSKELIEIEEGEDLVCPGCQDAKSLSPVDAASTSPRGLPRTLLLVAGAVLLVAVASWVFWPASPDPAKADSMLSDYFPRLQK